MGCDIHLYVEYSHARTTGWANFGSRFYPGRDYDTFARLAGVRGKSEALIPPRGLPAWNSLSWQVCNDYFLIVDEQFKDEGYCSPVDAERWVKNGTSTVWENGTLKRISHPDWHHASWLTTQEWISATEKSGVEYQIISDILVGFESRGYAVRVVFWFDN